MRQRIEQGYKAALKAGEKRRIATLRAISAAIKNLEIEGRAQGRDAPGDADILVLVQKMVKQREESEAIYAQAGREDLAAIEREEIAVLGEFLPRPLSEAEVDAAIRATISETAASGSKDMGRVIAALRTAYPGRIDMAKVSTKVKAALG